MKQPVLILLAAVSLTETSSWASVYSDQIEAGSSAYQKKDLVTAEKAFSVALTEGKKVGDDSLEVAEALNDLGVLYDETKRYDQAESAYKTALSIREKRLGANDMAVSITLNNLANCYKDQGNYAAAEQLYRKSIDIALKQEGSKGTDLIRSYYNLGMMFKQEKHYADEVSMMKQSLDLCDHSSDSESRNHLMDIVGELAVAYDNLGQKANAKPLFKRYIDDVMKELPGGLSEADKITNLKDFVAFARKQHDERTAYAMEKAIEYHATAGK